MTVDRLEELKVESLPAGKGRLKVEGFARHHALAWWIDAIGE